MARLPLFAPKPIAERAGTPAGLRRRQPGDAADPAAAGGASATGRSTGPRRRRRPCCWTRCGRWRRCCGRGGRWPWTRSASAVKSRVSATASRGRPTTSSARKRRPPRRAVQVYGEVRNFTCRPRGPPTNVPGRRGGDPRFRQQRARVPHRLPGGVERSQTPRQDYFINLQFHMPRLPEGRYTLHVLVKDMLAPAGDDAAREPSPARSTSRWAAPAARARPMGITVCPMGL